MPSPLDKLLPYVTRYRGRFAFGLVFLVLATTNQLISPNSDRAIKKLESGNFNLTRSEKSAMNHLLSRLGEIGVEIPGG